MLTSEERKALVAYRIEKAKAVLVEARDNARLGHWSLVGNRLYYAVYHMAQALLLDKGLSAKTHAGTIHIIGQQFISVGLIDKTYGRLFSRLYELRHLVTMMICLMLRRKKLCLILFRLRNLSMKWKH